MTDGLEECLLNFHWTLPSSSDENFSVNSRITGVPLINGPLDQADSLQYVLKIASLVTVDLGNLFAGLAPRLQLCVR